MKDGGSKGKAMRGLGTDHVTSGSMTGLKKTASNDANRQTNRGTDMATL